MATRRSLRPLPSALAVVVTGVVLVGCSAAGGSPGATASSASSTAGTTAPSSAATGTDVTPAPTEMPSADAPGGTAGFSCGDTATGVGSTARAQITDVRVGTHDGYDRIVFEFDGGIPEFRVEAAAPPLTQDASGQPLDVAGTRFVRIGLNGGTKLAPDGTLTYRGPTDVKAAYPALVELIEGGDFEAVSTWYAGLSTAQPCLRVFTLSDAPRLVVDVAH